MLLKLADQTLKLKIDRKAFSFKKNIFKKMTDLCMLLINFFFFLENDSNVSVFVRFCPGFRAAGWFRTT